LRDIFLICELRNFYIIQKFTNSILANSLQKYFSNQKIFKTNFSAYKTLQKNLQNFLSNFQKPIYKHQQFIS